MPLDGADPQRVSCDAAHKPLLHLPLGDKHGWRWSVTVQAFHANEEATSSKASTKHRPERRAERNLEATQLVGWRASLNGI